MMPFIKTSLLFSAMLLLVNCSKDMAPTEPDNLVNPQVIIDTLSTQGSIFIHCEVGPYYFNIDSLISHCQTNNPQNVNGCMYDNNAGMLGSTENYHFNIGAWPLSIEFATNFSYTSIDTLHFLPFNEMPGIGVHPYYGGFAINRTNSQFKFWYFNTYVGGCLHDKIIWEHKMF